MSVSFITGRTFGFISISTPGEELLGNVVDEDEYA
jgi:hypothetical protein